MQRKPFLVMFISTFVTIGFSASACSLMGSTSEQSTSIEDIQTAAVETISVELTLAAGKTAVAQLTELAQISSTEVPITPPTETPTIEQQFTATAEHLPSDTPELPTPTSLPPTPTIPPIPCGWAQFIEDVTVPDGANFTPKSEFTKTWRVKNIGLCTWTDEYDLVFVDGHQMNGLDETPFKGDVLPGEIVDLSVNLTAPENVGRYRGDWKLRADTGVHFGIGQAANDPLWVEIRVYDPEKYAFDFGSRYCEAEWRSDAGRLPCPGVPGDNNGSVILVDNPVLEIERIENEAALWTHPYVTEDGFISGIYPEIEVKPTAHFRAVVGCMSGSPGCDVAFQLDYRIGDGEIFTLWELREVYDDEFTKVDVDLSALAGQKVHFILTVNANGSPKEDNAFWLVPRIVD